MSFKTKAEEARKAFFAGAEKYGRKAAEEVLAGPGGREAYERALRMLSVVVGDEWHQAYMAAYRAAGER